MVRASAFDLAMLHAQKLVINELKLDALPIDPVAIAEGRDILVEPMPPGDKGVSGMLVRDGNRFAIGYATYIRSEGFQRFSIGHELGHYFLPGHIDAVLPPGATQHMSRGGFVSDNKYELEADHFSAGLLMPAPLFRRAMSNAGEGLSAVEKLARTCTTSLTSTAIRYRQLTNDAVAVIQSSGDRIEFCFMSDRMLALHPERWPRKGDPLPKSSATYRFNQDKTKVANAAKADGSTDTSEWFSDRRDIALFEETIGLGSYGKTLTILSTVDPVADEDEPDEDAELAESWTPHHRRR
jgi:Zn-dependent peptidase ImmA (M78 family)